MNELLVLTPTAVTGVRFYLRLSVCLFVCFRTISQKPMQLGSPNFTQRCSTTSPEKAFILGVKRFMNEVYERSRSRVKNKKNIAGEGLCTPVSIGFF